MITTTYNNKVMELFNDPFLIGFSREIDRFNSLQKTNASVSYPPYNVVKYTDDEYGLYLAVAGFSKQDLSVTVDDGYLIVSGNIESITTEPEFLHKGISTRKFMRKFILAEHMEVDYSSLHNGILSIGVIRNVPEEKKPKQIEIT